MTSTPSFAVLLQGFFTQRLMSQRQASPHTIGSYRDTFRLLLRFAQTRLKKPPSCDEPRSFAEIEPRKVAA